jgi:ADP-heptose:LPS heptosyltransferase
MFPSHDRRGWELAQLQGPPLEGVKFLDTETFTEALSWMAASEGYIGPEGGLHHAAAAFGKPAVVVFGGYIHPNVTGYDFHENLGGDWCGARNPCNHCREKLDEITVEDVVNAAERIRHRT